MKPDKNFPLDYSFLQRKLNKNGINLNELLNGRIPFVVSFNSVSELLYGETPRVSYELRDIKKGIRKWKKAVTIMMDIGHEVRPTTKVHVLGLMYPNVVLFSDITPDPPHIPSIFGIRVGSTVFAITREDSARKMRTTYTQVLKTIVKAIVVKKPTRGSRKPSVH